MEKHKSISEYLSRFDRGEYDSPDVHTQCEAGWYDWFCKDTSLAAKTKTLTKKLKTIIGSPKFDVSKTYVFFKNNCPCDGRLYDDFRICDLKTGDVIYTISPSIGYNTPDQGKAQVYGRENDFNGPLVVGTWADVKFFFGVGEDPKKVSEKKKLNAHIDNVKLEIQALLLTIKENQKVVDSSRARLAEARLLLESLINTKRKV